MSTIDVQRVQEDGPLSQVVLHLRLLVAVEAHPRLVHLRVIFIILRPTTYHALYLMNSSKQQLRFEVAVFLAPDVRLCFDFDRLRQLTDRCKRSYQLYLRADRHLTYSYLVSGGVITPTRRGDHHPALQLCFECTLTWYPRPNPTERGDNSLSDAPRIFKEVVLWPLARRGLTVHNAKKSSEELGNSSDT